jgi:NAD kinase
MPQFEKLVAITRRTALEELTERFNTQEQARFYLEHMGASFDEYLAAHRAYAASLTLLRQVLPGEVRSQFVERAFLPNFAFGPKDLILTLGPDGLVVNTAKYLTEQPILALNPDPGRIDGVLVPFGISEAPTALKGVLGGAFRATHISMAVARLNDGQTLHAVNDLFIGQRTHVSARYHMRFRETAEDQSSSGIIVSTGAGSTGWYRSILTGAAGVARDFANDLDFSGVASAYRFDWEADHLQFSVREPFISRTSRARLIHGRIEAGEELEIVSQMPQNGVIFSDGVEADYLAFNSGASARISLADRKVHLITGV